MENFKLLRISEVSKFLGVHPQTLRRWEKKGLIKAIKIGYQRRFKMDEILNLLKIESVEK